MQTNKHTHTYTHTHVYVNFVQCSFCIIFPILSLLILTLMNKRFAVMEHNVQGININYIFWHFN